MKNIIIGTAGHIDHGKTTLIKALTGRNTDRWEEEQRRGITIDLGFTYFDLKSGDRVGIIDVPGHEKFINNMVAGVVGMDLVMLVIAADEGIMPQTREHMDILGLLGIEKSIIVLNKCDLVEEEWIELVEEEVKEELEGTFLENAPVMKVSAVGIEKSIIVLNKCDLVEEEWIELVEEEVKEELEGTFLENAPVMKVSAATGQGIPELIDMIEKLTADEVEQKDINTIPRLPIDRAFSMSGFGTVITGTLLAGSITKEDTLEMYPIGKECKIRSIQVHGQPVERCYAGQRVAINLSNIKKSEIKRGCVLAPPNNMKNTMMLDVKMNILPSSMRILTNHARLHLFTGTSEVLCRAILLDKEEIGPGESGYVQLRILPSSMRILTNHARLHLFTGTSEVLCRAILLDKEEIGPGESGYVQLRLEEEIALRRGDKFIVRFYSPMETIGGGVVLEPNPTKKKRFHQETIEELERKESGSSEDIIDMHIHNSKDAMMTVAELAKITALSLDEVTEDVKSLEDQGMIKVFHMKKDSYTWHSSNDKAFQTELVEKLSDYHEKHPYRYGMQNQGMIKVFHMKKDSYTWHSSNDKAFQTELVEKLSDYHEKHPYRYGMQKAEIHNTFLKKVKPTVFDLYIDNLVEEGVIKRHNEFLSLPSHEIKKDALYEKTEKKLLEVFEKAQLDFPKLSEVDMGGIESDVIDDILLLLMEEGKIVKLGEELYTLTPYIENSKQIIQGLLSQKDLITMGEIRDALETSRKNAKLIVEYMDSIKVTKRNGTESERVAY